MVATISRGLGKFLIFSLLMLFSTTAAEYDLECQQIQATFDVQPDVLWVQWSTNPCAMAYQVSQYINGILNNTLIVPHPFSSVTLQRIDCSVNSVQISTLVIPGFDPFEDVYGNFSILWNGTAEVQNLRFNDLFNRFEWDPPFVPAGCNFTIEYEISFQNENVRENAVVTNTSFQIPNHPCTTNVINVTTLIGPNISRSDPTFDIALLPVSRQLPWHIATIPGVDSVTVLWEVIYEPYNLCEIQGLQFHLINNATQEERFINRTFNANSTLIDVTLESLEPNSSYTYRACYFLAWSNWTICSHSVQFTTLSGNVTVPSVSLWTELTSNGFVVFWGNNSTDMVTGYTLRIQPIGPAHVVPSDCSFNLYSIERFFNGSGVFSYNMTYAEPSFNYSVQLQTHIDGINATNGTSTGIWVVTREGVPGDLSIQSSYLGAPSSPYDVTLRADWNIPCDINGKVRRFNYTLTGTLSSRSNVLCRDAVLSSGAIEVSGYLEQQQTFTILVPDILPSFNYTLWVTTQTGFSNATTALGVGPAPRAYTSPDWRCNAWTYG